MTNTLAKGSLAYLDTFSGLVPCKVLAIVDTRPANAQPCPTCLGVLTINGKDVPTKWVDTVSCPTCANQRFVVDGKPRYGLHFELLKGGIRSSLKATIKLTAKRGAYRKGEVIETFAYDVIPRKAIRFRKYSPVITAYQVQVG